MTERNRKLLGTLLLVLTVVVYPALATWVYLTFLAEQPTAGLLVFFAIAGLGWLVPAMAIIRWMSAPDASR